MVRIRDQPWPTPGEYKQSIVGKSDSDGLYLILTKTSDCGNTSAEVKPACRPIILSQLSFT